MKKTLYGIAVSALTLVTFFGGSTAHAASPSQYYMVLMQEQAPKNCTARHSDLGLGGGVFVAGTSFCEDQSPTMMMLIGGFDDSYEDSDDYYDEDEYEDEYDDSDEDEEYEEDYDDSDNDDNQSDQDEDDESDNDSDDNDYGSHSW